MAGKDSYWYVTAERAGNLKFVFRVGAKPHKFQVLKTTQQ